MSLATQTFGLPLNRAHMQRGGSFTAIGVRMWMSLVAKIKAHRAAAEARAEQELLALAAMYEKSFPSFAAELRAANCRRG